MADEQATISTPAEGSNVATSENAETANVDTSALETTVETNANEEEGTQGTQEKLYANKYKSIEDFEKGYEEAQKLISKNANFEKKYNELLAKQQADIEKIEAQKLQEAKYQGFNSVEAQEISQKIQLAEFEAYANNINLVAPENAQVAQEALINYFNSGNKAFLNQAKQFFNADFVEKVALQKNQIEAQLTNELRQKQNAQNEKKMQELAKTLGEKHADFLADVKENQGKAQALEKFCQAGLIQSEEDMQAFIDVYSNIEKQIKELAIKDYLAQQAIEKTKQGASIEANASMVINGEEMPSYDQIAKMSQEEYNKAFAKYGNKLLMAK